MIEIKRDEIGIFKNSKLNLEQYLNILLSRLCQSKGCGISICDGVQID